MNMATEKSTETFTAYCCYTKPGTNLGCVRSAEFVIVWGGAPHDYTHSCTEHVGEMLMGDEGTVEWNVSVLGLDA